MVTEHANESRGRRPGGTVRLPIDRKAEALRALSALCAQLYRLAGHEIGVRLLDAWPRIEVTKRDWTVDVRVSDDEPEFVIRPLPRRHAVTDVQGAAEAVLAMLRELADSGASDGELSGSQATGGAAEEVSAVAYPRDRREVAC